MPRFIDSWAWDYEEDGNVEHLATHEVTPRIVLEVAAMGPKFRDNVEERTATHQMIGPDKAMDWWTICIVEDDQVEGRWKAITGWTSTDGEREWYWEVTS